MRFFEKHPNIRMALSILLLVAEIALLFAFQVTGLTLLIRISDILEQTNRNLVDYQVIST